MERSGSRRKSQKGGVLNALKDLVHKKAPNPKDALRTDPDSTTSQVSARHTPPDVSELRKLSKQGSSVAAPPTLSITEHDAPQSSISRSVSGTNNGPRHLPDEPTFSTINSDVPLIPIQRNLSDAEQSSMQHDNEHADNLTAPGQFPDDAEESLGPNLLMASLQIPAFLGLDYSPFDLYKTSDKGENGASDIDDLPSSFYSGSEQAIMADSGENTDFFEEKLNKKSGRSKHVFKSTNRTTPSSPKELASPHGSPRTHDDDWTITDEPDLFPEQEGDFGDELHSNGSRLMGVNKSLHELDEVEINEFLNHFSRHTREVHLPHATRHFMRMPQWSDFAYSSDEHDDDITPFAPNEKLAQRHRRSRLLMHVDRGLYMLESHDDPNEHYSDAAAYTPNEDVDSPKGPRPESSQNTSTMSGRDSAVSRQSSINVAMEPYEVDIALDSGEDNFSDNVEVSPLPKSPKRVRIGKDHARKTPLLDDAHVDGIAFCVAYILALVEQYAPDDLDEAPITEYRESRARSHIERLYIIAPFWEQLVHYLRTLYCWEEPRRTAAAAMIYFVLWYSDLLPTAFFTVLLYYVLQFRFFPQDESLLHRRVHERMLRGQHANRLAERLKRRSRLDILDLYKRWARTYGVVSQVFAGDVADFHEKIKNLLLWRNPNASRRTSILLFGLVVFATLSSPALILKVFFFVCGFTFFALMPLQTLYPRYRRALNPLWWAVLGAPTDAQWAIQLLRSRHARYQAWLAQTKNSTMKYSGSMSPSMPPPSLGDTRISQTQQRTGKSHLNIPTDKASKGKAIAMDNRKLDSFLCQHYGVPGHLNVTPSHFYFSPLLVKGHASKLYVTSLEEMEGLRKTHTTRLGIWDSHGLKITRHGKNTLYLSNMARRDEAFNLLLTLASHIVQDLV